MRASLFFTAALAGSVFATACGNSPRKDGGTDALPKPDARPDAAPDASPDAAPDAEEADAPALDAESPDLGMPDGGEFGMLSASDQHFDFGSAIVGAEGMHHVFTFKNVGQGSTGPLTTAITGIDRTSFLTVQNGCNGQTLAANASCMVQLEFLPNASGSLQAVLSAQASPGGTASIMISGTGQAPARLSVAPPTHDFGNDPLQTRVTQDFAFTNGGDLASGTLNAFLNGVNSTDFSLSSDHCSGMMLAPTHTCTITVAFDPMTIGAKNAALELAGMPGGTALAELTGIAIQPARLVSNPPQFNFNNAVIRAPGNTQTFQIMNNGGVPSGSITATITSAANPGDFTISSNACAGLVLGVNSTCMINVTFAPNTVGAKMATLAVSAMPGGSLSIMLSGAGVPEQPITVTPSMRSYGSTPNMTMGMPVMFVVNNPNPSATGVLTATISGMNSAEFQISMDNCTGMRVARMMNCTLGVAFNPITIGNKSASLDITGTNGESAHAAITALSIPPPQLTFNVSAYSFGTHDVRTTSTFRFFLRNNGSTPTGPAAITIMGSSDFTLANNLCQGTLLGAGQACSVDVQFTPSTGGPRNATLTAVAAPGGTTSATVDGIGNDQFNLTVQTMGSGGGTVTGTNISCQPMCQAPFMDGTMVTLTANPDNVSSFTGWGGACTGAGNCTVTMDQARNVIATFDLRNFTINVTINDIGTATGTVTSSPMGLSCHPTCSASYLARTRVVLTASAAPGVAFQGWGGDCSASGFGRTCTLTLAQDVNVTAGFTPYNIAFVTRATFTPGHLGGLAGGDSACAAAALSANFPGTYRAWLSTSTVSAVQRLTTVNPQPRGWVRPDGQPFVDSLALLQAGEVLFPLRVSEDRTTYTTETDVMTGTNADGSAVANLNCGDWRLTTGTMIFGDATAGTESWTSFGSASCANPGYRIYCFGTSYQAPLRFTQSRGRLAFLTDGQFNPSQGLSGADALCMTEATHSGLPGMYRALLSTSNASALSRFDLTGAPWVRPDGIPVVAHAADLATSPLAALSVRANGTYLGRGFVWTGVMGSPSNASTTMLTCRDWTSNSASDQGTVGYESTTAPGNWDAFGQEPCSYQLGHLYCLEE